jgi:hypothetical protein
MEIIRSDENMSSEYQKRLNAIKSCFSFLLGEFGFKLVSDQVSRYGVTVLYQSQAAGVEVYYQPRENGGILVDLIRLINGEVPSYPDSSLDSSTLHTFDTRDLLYLRKDRLEQDIREKLKENIPFSAEEAARLLKKYCNDVLIGDFSVFSRLEEIVKQRAKALAEKYPTNDRA